MRALTVALCFSVFLVVPGAAMAQTKAAPQELWTQSHVVKGGGEVWGDDGHCGCGVRHYGKSCGCCPLLSHIGSCLKGALSCLFPCQSGCGCGGGMGCLPSVRFNSTGCDHGYDSKMMEQPVMLEPIQQNAPAQDTTGARYYRRRGATPSRPVTSRMVRPAPTRAAHRHPTPTRQATAARPIRTTSVAKTKATARPVSYEAPTKSTADQKIPHNPLRR